MTINNQFDLDELVYLKTDTDQKQRMVVSINISCNADRLVYVLACGTEVSHHFEQELSHEKNLVSSFQ